MNYWIVLLYLLQINLAVKYFLIFVLSNLMIKESNILFYKLSTDLEEWWQSNDFIWHDISEHKSFSKSYQFTWNRNNYKHEHKKYNSSTEDNNDMKWE